jgi:hypothetical protein
MFKNEKKKIFLSPLQGSKMLYGTYPGLRSLCSLTRGYYRTSPAGDF